MEPPARDGLMAARDATNVIFVCEHGSAKSLVASSYFNRFAGARGLRLRALSRGTAPDVSVPGPVREGLARDGLDVSDFRPQQFVAVEARGAALVVAFDQDLSASLAGAVPIERWDGLPALSEDFVVGRDSIRARVEALVTRLAADCVANARAPHCR